MESDNAPSSNKFDIHPPNFSLERNPKKERTKCLVFIILKLYDLFNGTELGDIVYKSIPIPEVQQITDWSYEAIDNIYDYRNSAAGIMEAIGRDYSDLELDADKIKGDIANPENLTLLKDVLTKLG